MYKKNDQNRRKNTVSSFEGLNIFFFINLNETQADNKTGDNFTNNNNQNNRLGFRIV